MKQKDFFFALIALLIFLPFVPLPFLEDFQSGFLYNEKFWVLTSFLKFALLATLGEVIGLRVKEGVYNKTGFGILPRALVWGVLGISIKLAFVVFSVGVPVFLAKSCGLDTAVEAMKSADLFSAMNAGLFWERLLTAFCISVVMNTFFAPVMMTFHKITDTHITDNGGTVTGLLHPVRFGNIFPRINWFVQWDFVFKRTIPLFWFPAHTITFLLPGEYRVVFAALLGVVLGIFLAMASIRGKAEK
jgi:hypothetical protein